jgi:hypothetical protein
MTPLSATERRRNTVLQLYLFAHRIDNFMSILFPTVTFLIFVLYVFDQLARRNDSFLLSGLFVSPEKGPTGNRMRHRSEPRMRHRPEPSSHNKIRNFSEIPPKFRPIICQTSSFYSISIYHEYP